MLLNCGVGEDSWEVLDCKEIKLVNPKGNQSWIFIGRTDSEAEAPILWPPDMKSRLTGKYLDAGKDWGQEEKGKTEDEMVGWHHQHEFEQTLGGSEVQGSLACCSPWGSQRVRHDLVTEQQHHPSYPAGPNVGHGRGKKAPGDWQMVSVMTHTCHWHKSSLDKT